MTAYLAALRASHLRWRQAHPAVARFDGKAVTKEDATGQLMAAAALLTGKEPVDYDGVEESLHRALRLMAQALHNWGRAQGSGRPSGRCRKGDRKWEAKLYHLHLEQPQLGPYELARKVTGRARGDPLVVRLARAESKRRRKARDFKAADKAGNSV